MQHLSFGRRRQDNQAINLNQQRVLSVQLDRRRDVSRWRQRSVRCWTSTTTHRVMTIWRAQTAGPSVSRSAARSPGRLIAAACPLLHRPCRDRPRHKSSRPNCSMQRHLSPRRCPAAGSCSDNHPSTVDAIVDWLPCSLQCGAFLCRY